MARAAALEQPADGVSSPAVQRLNPSPWSAREGHDHGQLRARPGAVLTIGGQRPVDAEGRLLHEGDTAAQLALALANLSAVVRDAGMALSDLAQLRIHTTAMFRLVEVQDLLTDYLADAGATPPLTLVEVRRLALDGMDLEIEALAIATTGTTKGNPS